MAWFCALQSILTTSASLTSSDELMPCHKNISSGQNYTSIYVYTYEHVLIAGEFTVLVCMRSCHLYLTTVNRLLALVVINIVVSEGQITPFCTTMRVGLAH